MSKKYSKILSVILAVALCLGALTVFANAANPKFTDVPTGSWFYTAVTQCANNGYVSGVGNNLFLPEGKLTYAQIFTMFTNAFYKAEKQSYENNRYLEMDAYFGGNPQWYGYNAFYFNDNGLLKGVDVNIKSTASANSPISRYDVVQIANNILKNKGITVSEAQKAEAQAKISDWGSVPSLYREAVSSCYYLGIISGYTGGRFGGNDTLTRAQACVILNQLEKVVIAGPQSGNGNSGNGVLANGKPITETNVKALLAEIEKKYPTGMLWCERTTNSATNYNTNTVSDTVKQIVERKYNVSTMYGCGGFAAMVSDLVFGQNNPMREVTDLSVIRPGDIIIQMNGRTVKHVMIAADNSFVNNGFTGVHTADGNNGNEIVWPATNDSNNVWLSPSASTYVVYTRYPD